MFTLLSGDCLSLLEGLPDQSVHCCITSPPYYQLRNYDHPGQVGQEQTPGEYIQRLVEIFRQVRRVLRKDGSVYNPQMEEGAAYVQRGAAKEARIYGAVKGVGPRQNHGTRYPRSVMRFSRAVPSLHPTQKPQPLLRWLVRTYSHPGQIVLDPFFGSGSTGMASLTEGRFFIGMEGDPQHFNPAEQRIGAFLHERAYRTDIGPSQEGASGSEDMD